MKLYVFRPSAHGQFTLIVMANNDLEAVDLIRKHIGRNGGEGRYEYLGWGTDWYTREVYAVGEVAENDNE